MDASPEALPEKRAHPRFELGPGVFAVVKSDGETLGEVLNVSEGGLALKYVAGLGTRIPKGTLDVFATKGVSYLIDVPVRTVSDFEIPNNVDFSTIRLRRMGVAFENLTQAQRQSLRDFIKENRAN